MMDHILLFLSMPQKNLGIHEVGSINFSGILRTFVMNDLLQISIRGLLNSFFWYVSTF